MSFYGRVFYELSSAFASIVIKKKYSDTEGIPLVAVGTGGTLTFQPGNQWIEMDVNSDDYVCAIKHAASDDERSAKGTITPFKRETTAQASAVQLVAADTISVPVFSYDDAGHVIKIVDTQYYKMPISETESDIIQLQADMKSLKENEDNQNTSINILTDATEQCSSDIELLDERIGNLEPYTRQVDSNQTAIEALENLVGSRADMFAESTMTISQYLGSYGKMGYDTIADGIQTLRNDVTAANSSTANNALATKLALKKLCDILNSCTLIDASGNRVVIDYTSLWDV